MKQILILLLAVTLTGCSLMGDDTNSKKTETTETKTEPAGTERPGVEKAQTHSVNDFYFESGQDGLTLKHRTNTKFSSVLSDQPIESAEIIEGILLFQEKNGLQAQKTFNLESILSSWQ